MNRMLPVSQDIVHYAYRVPGVLPVSYATRELIFPAGGFASGVHLVTRGLVGLYAPSAKEKVAFHVLRSGDLLGLEAWLFPERPQYLATARALTDVDLLFFPPPVWTKVLEDPEFQRLLFAAIAQTWKGMVTKSIYQLEAKSAVAWAFQHWGEPTPQGLRLPLSLGLLAQVLNLSRTTVKLALQRLNVAQNGEFLIWSMGSAQEILASTESPR